MLMLSVLCHTNQDKTFNWVSGATVTNRIKPKKASECLFHPVISPKTHSMILIGFKWPPGHPTRLMLSGLGYINPITFNWFSGASYVIELKPEKASGPLFHPVIPPNTFLRYCKGLSDPQATFLCWCYQFYGISTPKIPSIGSQDPQKPLKSSPKRLLDLCFTHLFPPNTFLWYCKSSNDPQATLLCWYCQFYTIWTLKIPSFRCWNPQKSLKSSPKWLLGLCFTHFKLSQGHPTMLMLKVLCNINLRTPSFGSLKPQKPLEAIPEIE